MTLRYRTQSAVNAALGSLGFLLIALLGWASERESMKSRTPIEYLTRFLGLIVILGVTATGYVLDWRLNQGQGSGLQPRFRRQREEEQHV